MTCEPPSPPATLLPSPHPPETIFESVAPAEPCRHLHPRRWETMGARLPSPAPDRPHRPRVSLKAVPSALGVCHLWGGCWGVLGVFFPPPPQAWLLLRVWLCFSGGGFAVPGWEGGGGSAQRLQHPAAGDTGRSWDSCGRWAAGNSKLLPTLLCAPMPTEQLLCASGDPQDGDAPAAPHVGMDGETPLGEAALPLWEDPRLFPRNYLLSRFGTLSSPPTPQPYPATCKNAER